MRPRTLPALLLPLVVAGCAAAPEQPAAPQTSTVTVTTQAAPTTPEPTCGVDTEAAAIYDNIHRVPPPTLPGEGWEYYGHSDYNPCADLSYAVVFVTGSTHAQKQNQMMLFHRGEYLGVGLLVPQVYRHWEGDGEAVHVRVIDREAMDVAGAPNAAAADYEVELTFWWNGERVEPIGRIPNLSHAE